MKPNEIYENFPLHYILDHEKNVIPATLKQWANVFENTDRRVGEYILNEFRISTVFLGINLNPYSLEGSPLVFETMVFRELPTSSEVIYCRRYATWNEAKEGHQKACEWVINGCIDEDE